MIGSTPSTTIRLFLVGALGLGSFLCCSPVARAAELPPGFTLLPKVAGEAKVDGARKATTSTLQQPTETDDRLRRADQHFQNGRQFYFQGDLPSAHREFDLAVDVLLTAPETLPDHRRLEKRLDELCENIYRFDIEKLGAGETPGTEVAFDKAPIDEISHMTFPVDPSMSAKLKSELNQTASGIPLELSDPVLSYVHYFSSDRGRAILESGLRRSGRYRPMIQRVFAEEGVPDELIYLAQAESGFLPRAVSYKQAVGMWQFISGTASRYDLVRTNALDERLDPEKATRAAAKYLKDLHTRYGDWYLAMAAYNCGEGAVDRAVERTGYADYWELLKRHALPKETASYVPIIVAMTIMAKNPQDYGLQNIEPENPLEYESIQLTASTNLNLIADATLQPLSVIRDLNPSLLKMVVPSGFQIHVPKGAAETTIAALEKVPAANRDAWRLHHVDAGDTLETIARTYHVTPNSIASVNSAVESARSPINQGSLLLIPASFHEVERSSRVSVKRGAKATRVQIAAGKHGATLNRNVRVAAVPRRISTSSLAHKATVRPRIAH